MEHLLILVGIILTFIAGIIPVIFEEKRELIVIAYIATFILLFTGYICCVCAVEHVRDIPPIEVYRGNTTLKITYQDGTPIDSVVVYKKK